MRDNSIPLILGSGSPRRRQLLTEAGYTFQVIRPDDSAEQGNELRESPRELVVRLARQKAADVARQVERGVVVACDTIVECGGHVLGKPPHREDASRMLRLLRSRIHHVYSGVCLWRRPDDRILANVDVTKLRMDNRSDRDIEEYLDSGDWQGKAGAFGYQDRHHWIHIIKGSESNVVGLPMELLAEMLAVMARY
jgi:septum formation protein